MAAAASAVIVPALAKGARSAAGTISEALTADLAVVRWSYQPRARRKVKPAPIDMELHVNPAAIGVAAVGVGLSLWLMQLRLGPYNKTVQWGKWMWADGSAASAILDYTKRGSAPRAYRPVYKTIIEYVEWGDGRTHPEEHRVIDYYQWESATWTNLHSETVKKYGIEQRKGFSNPIEPILLSADAATSAWGVFWDKVMNPFG